MKVLFFARARQLAGCENHLLHADGPLSVPEFWDRLGRDFPALLPLQKTSRLARNHAYVGDDEQLQPGDEIAVIPPVSGG